MHACTSEHRSSTSPPPVVQGINKRHTICLHINMYSFAVCTSCNCKPSNSYSTHADLHPPARVYFNPFCLRASTTTQAESVCPTYSLDDASMCLQKAVGFSSLVHGHGGGFAAGSWIIRQPLLDKGHQSARQHLSITDLCS